MGLTTCSQIPRTSTAVFGLHHGVYTQRCVHTAVDLALSSFKRRVEPNMEGFGSTRLLNAQVRPYLRGTSMYTSRYSCTMVNAWVNVHVCTGKWYTVHL